MKISPFQDLICNVVVHGSGQVFRGTPLPNKRALLPAGNGALCSSSFVQSKKRKPLSVQLKFCSALVKEFFTKKHLVSLELYTT